MSVDPSFDPLADFFAYCPAMLLVADAGGVILRLSAALGRLLGPSARVGAKLSAILAPEDLGAFEAGWARLVAGGAPVEIDLRMRASDGAARDGTAVTPVTFRAQRSPSRGEIHAEIKERAVGAAELERDAGILRVILDNLPIMVSRFDAHGVYQYHEGRGLERAGLSPGGLVGQNVFEVLADHPSLGLVRQAAAGELAHSFGEIYGLPLEVWDIPVLDPHGKVEAILGVTLDVSDAKSIETELRNKVALLERAQQVIQEMATPIIEVWDKVLTLPMLGVVDSVRAADVMENLLTQVSRKGARFAILDLTGVDAVDTGTAAHLLKLVQALRLLGAEGIITGIQPSVAQTMVALGVDMENVVTLANLRDGLRLCMRRLREEKVGASVKGPAEPANGAPLNVTVDKKG